MSARDDRIYIAALNAEIKQVSASYNALLLDLCHALGSYPQEPPTDTWKPEGIAIIIADACSRIRQLRSLQDRFARLSDAINDDRNAASKDACCFATLRNVRRRANP